MKNRFLALLLALGMLLSLSVPAFATDSEDEALRTVRALGILVGDEKGDLNLSANVTRAQFAKMMVVASSYRDSVGGETGSALYKDVKSSHWASEYIRLAVSAGWFVGYSDGTFRPDNTITLEEACTAVLRLLGYDSSTLTGAYPAAQLSKAAAVGLRDGLSIEKGVKLTRAQCVTLFYNLVTCKTNSGQIYAQTLGYTVTNGELDYGTLVEANLSGPYISDGTAPTLPFTAVNMTVYRNGAKAARSSIAQYDVYYYNLYLRTVWIYSDRASGTITAVSPNTVSPTAVTVAGVSYQLGTDEAAYALSDMGSFAVGDTVTLLLGMDGGAVKVLSSAESETVYYGVVLSSEKVSTSSGSASVQVSVRIACSDGAARTFSVASGSFEAGDVVMASVASDGVSVSTITSKKLEGSVNSAGTALAGYTLASDVEILETADNGAYATVLPSRLKSARFDAGEILYWALNEHGELSCLILGDATGDLWTYGILTSVANSDLSSTSASGRYAYICDGKSGTVSTSGTQFTVDVGGAAFLYGTGNTLNGLHNLRSATGTELSSLYVRAGAKKYLLADSLQVYLKEDGDYYATTLSAVNLENYTLTAWYDDLGCPAGGLVRILVAVEK